MRRPRIAATAALLTAALAALGAAGIPPGNADVAPLDLLAGYDWSHFSGATVQPDGVHITPLNRQVVDQNGTGGQANPPVNLRGPQLVPSGDFSVDAVMDRVGTKGAYLQLYGAPPIIYDEWRQEPPSVRVGVQGGKLKVAIYKGTSDQPTSKTYGSGLSGRVTVRVTSAAGQLRFAVNGSQLASLPDPGLFSSHRVWFGTDAELGGGWTLAGLTAEGSLTVKRPPALAQPVLADSLRKRAAARSRPVDMGAALAYSPLLADSGYRALAGGQFSMLTPENAFKPQFVQPTRGVFDWQEADLLVEFARANSMKVHAHTLVWHEALPLWMRDVTGSSNVRQLMLSHIDAVAGHFKGQVVSWDVVNEPISDEDKDYTNGNKGLRSDQSPFFQAMGEQYIDIALREAHRIDPSAKLFINEYGIEQDGQRWDALLALVKRLKARGVPLDGIGFQNHEYEPGDRTPVAQFRAKVRALAALGVQSRISEMDVLVGSGSAEAQIQAKEFAGKLQVCVTEPTCTSFTSWGFTDRYGSTADAGKYPPAPGNALPWDENLRPKSAYTSLLNTLS